MAVADDLLLAPRVHNDVAQAEVDTCVMQTYLLACETIRILEDSPKGDPTQ